VVKGQAQSRVRSIAIRVSEVSSVRLRRRRPSDEEARQTRRRDGEAGGLREADPGREGSVDLAEGIPILVRWLGAGHGSGLFVTHELTSSGSDRPQRATLSAKVALKSISSKRLPLVAVRKEIIACERAHIPMKPLTSHIQAKGRFGKQDFVNVSDEDVYCYRLVRSSFVVKRVPRVATEMA
jgi:hypothetical protein